MKTTHSSADRGMLRWLRPSRRQGTRSFGDAGNQGGRRAPRGRGVRRMLGAFAVTGVAAGALLGITGGAANADSTAFTVRLAPESNLLLNVEVYQGSYDWGAPIDQWSQNGGTNQVWNFVSVGNAFEIVNAKSGLCMTTDDVAGDTVYQFPCVGADEQLWWSGIRPSNFVAYSIQSKSSGLYLDVNGGSPWNGANIDTWYWNGGKNQYFAATYA